MFLSFFQLRGSLMAFTPKRKCFRSQSLVGLGDVTAAAWGMARSALGLERQTPEETEPAARPVSLGLDQ